VDSVSVRAKRGGEHTGPNPTDRGKAGSKYHFLADRQGTPLAVQLTAANVHDSVEVLVDSVQPIHRPTGEPERPRKRPAKLHADKGYDFPQKRRALRQCGITPRIARRGVESSQRPGRHRWVVERTQAWVVAFRKLARCATTGRQRPSLHSCTSFALLSACVSWHTPSSSPLKPPVSSSLNLRLRSGGSCDCCFDCWEPGGGSGP
jgi:transposase